MSNQTLERSLKFKIRFNLKVAALAVMLIGLLWGPGTLVLCKV